MKIGLAFVGLIVVLAAFSWLKSSRADTKTKTVFLGKSSDVSFQRVAMQRLSQAILSDKETMIFKIQWTIERDGKTANPEIVYQRIPQTLQFGNFEYSPVTDDAIHSVSAKQDPVVGLSEYGGATQKVSVTSSSP